LTTEDFNKFSAKIMGWVYIWLGFVSHCSTIHHILHILP